MSDVPEIRFKGFTDAWEQRRLDMIADETYGGGTPSTSEDSFWNGEIPWIQSSDINEHEVFGVLPKRSITYEGLQKSAAKIIPANSIAIITRVGVGKLALMPFSYTTSQDFLSLSKLKFDEWFAVYSLYRKLQTESYAVQGTSIKGITKDELLQKSVQIPKSTLEQATIGNFFHNLDDTIALHKRKLDGLRKLKKAYLQVMFPQAGETVPKVRFSGFDGAWEEVFLADVADRVTRKNEKLESTLPLTISAQHGLIDQNEFFNKQVASRDVSGYYLVKNGEFAYNKSYSNGYPWGAVKRLDRYDMGVLSTLYIVFNPIAIESEFLVHYYETDSWHMEIVKYAAEGARNHGLLNIAPTDFFKTVLVIPKYNEEQVAIGKIFRKLDERIAAQEQKTEQLNRLKSAYLKKMFV